MADQLRESLFSMAWERLRCPKCHAPFHAARCNSDIRCSACNSAYPILPTGLPVLLLPEQRTHFDAILSQDAGGKRMAVEYARYGSWKAKVRACFRPPSIAYDEDIPRKYSWIYDTRQEKTLVLSIGGGPGRENPRVINLNIDAFD